jgi:cobalt-zinc-cadmium efflux system protein
MGQHHDHSHHDHSHHGHSHAAPQKINQAFIWAVALNLGFTLIEAGYAFVANSMSLLADAGHNLGDVFGLLFSWGANWLLTKPANQQYSYGYKKTTILAALSNALLLVLATGVISYESILRLLHPKPITEIIIIAVAAIGIVINGGTALLFIKNSKEDLNIKSAFIHLASDALLSLGVVITGTIVFFTKWLWLDPFVGLCIAVTILIGTWNLMRDSVNLILDAVPRHIKQDKVLQYLKDLPGVVAIHDLHIWGLSTREVALSAHLVMPEHQLTDHDLHKINDHLKSEYKIDHATLQIERGNMEAPCGLAEKC